MYPVTYSMRGFTKGTRRRFLNDLRMFINDVEEQINRHEKWNVKCADYYNCKGIKSLRPVPIRRIKSLERHMKELLKLHDSVQDKLFFDPYRTEDGKIVTKYWRNKLKIKS
jgi:hypothetical protein